MTSLMHTVSFRKLGLVQGRGATLLNAKGKEYIDFFTDVGTASLGYHSNEMLVALDVVAHRGIVHSPILFQQHDRESAAKALCDFTEMDKVFFCNSGAESVEAAIKIARKRWWVKRGQYAGCEPVIWTQRGSFHGRTLAGLSAGDGPAYHKDGFQPLPKGFVHFNDWREINTVSALEGVPSISCAGVMVSPIFGNNDVRPFMGLNWHDGMMELRALRDWCTKHDIPLILDEVQTGSGRTACHTYGQEIGVRADILTLGKGVAMGAPVGACLARGEYAELLTPGTHFSTFGGNPLCATFLLGMLDWLNAPLRMGEIHDKGRVIEDYLHGVKHITSIRCQGMLIAADVDVDTKELAARCEDEGLLLGAFRQGPGVLKITPPLNITTTELMDGLGILQQCLEAV